MNRFFFVLLFAVTLHHTESYALNIKNNSLKNPNLFLIEFPASTRGFLARADSISHISLHDYITPPYKVVELTIDVSGQALLRIYHSHMLSPTELANTLGNSNSTYKQATKFRQPIEHAVQRVEQKMTSIVETPTMTTVIKEYPIATHAKNIEYRLSQLSELIDLYESLVKHWGGEKINDSDSLSINKETGKITPENTKKSSGRLRLGGSVFTVEH